MDVKPLGRNFPVPLYMWMKDFIRREIATGSWKSGERVPSETVLDTILRASWMTVQGMPNELVSDGLLRRVPGKDTFVTHWKVAMLLPVHRGVRGQSEQVGFTITAELVGTRRTVSGKAIRDGPRTTPSTLAHEVVCRRSVDSRPVSLHRSPVPVHPAPELEHDDVLGERLYVISKNKYGLRSLYAGEQLKVVAAAKEEADLLGLRPGTPLLLLQDMIPEASGGAFKFSKILLRSDRTKLRLDYRS